MIKHMHNTYGQGGIIMKKKKETAEEREKRELMEEINATLKDIQHSRHVFANADDPLLLEACVYEIKFLQAKYAFLLSRVKENVEASV